MVCPVCVIDGAIIASCRFLGVPDPITSFFLGILTLTFAIVTLKWLESKLLLNKTPKGALIIILTIYSVITIFSMQLIGMI